MPAQQQNRLAYLKLARAYARRQFNALLLTPEYRHCHESHAVARALELTEKHFTDLCTFGVEGDCGENGEDHITIQYLNSGDTYEATICYYKGCFIVASWGDIVR